ncbi:MAG: DUF3857 and transglutaminase domain-containing protein, partial [Ignavibacteriaceae bacterium]|nr:DUF3857 and transglutaminase domain-containing protein [Ignavibacteriaceae bacterium]
MKRIIALLNLSLLFYYPLYSQDENSYIDELSNISPEAIKIVDEYSATSFDQDTGAVIIFRESKVVVRDNKIDTITYHIIGKILDERARDDYSQIPIAFNSYYEDMKLDFARSINEDKTFINILEDAIQFKTPPEYMGSNTYTDTKILAFSIPALTINKYFEYQISITTKKPVVENHWFNTFYFNHRLRKLSDPYFIRIDPVKTSRFIVNVKRGNNFRFEISKAELEETKVVNEEFESYTWVMNNLKPIVFEAYMPYLFENLPSITVSSIENWNEFAEWAYSTLGTRVKVTNDILSKAVELTSDSKSKIESIKKIYDYVRSEIDYIQADLDRGGLTPHYSDEILRTKYGDCKDQVILMLSMLEAVGIDGYPALLSSYSFRNHQNYLP